MDSGLLENEMLKPGQPENERMNSGLLENEMLKPDPDKKESLVLYQFKKEPLGSDLSGSLKERRVIKMKRYKSLHMVRMEHLNHHSNLYAGQGIEWMIENAFIVVNCEYDNPQGILYKNTHKFDFSHSVYPGDNICYEGLIVRTGRTSLTIRVGMYNEKTGVLNAEGYTTFVTVNPETNKPVAHGIVLDEPADENEEKWRKEADSFFEKRR